MSLLALAFDRAACRYILCELSLLIPKLKMESLLCPTTGIQEYEMNAISSIRLGAELSLLYIHVWRLLFALALAPAVLCCAGIEMKLASTILA